MRSPLLILSLSLSLTIAGCASDAGNGTTSPGDTTTSGDDDAEPASDDAGPVSDEDALTEADDGPAPEADTTTESDAEEPIAADPVEVSGVWDTNFGMESHITHETWDGSAIVHHDNDQNWAITRMPDDAEWNPGTYSKFVWTEPTDGRWFLCIVTYGAADAEEAEATTATADDSDPTVSGCGDFPWTELRTPLEVKGDWHTNWDENLAVTTYAWGGDEAVAQHDNDANWAITRLSDDASWNPGTYSKLVWTEPADDGSFWMCTVAYGIDTLGNALADISEVDDSDPAAGGCGGFSWTYFMPVIEITGDWASEWGAHKIDSTVWGLDLVHAYDNAENWAVVQLPETDESSPNTYMKNVWTEPDTDGSFHYCTVAYGIENLDEALAAEDTSDDSDPTTGGCGGFAWTALTPE